MQGAARWWWVAVFLLLATHPGSLVIGTQSDCRIGGVFSPPEGRRWQVRVAGGNDGTQEGVCSGGARAEEIAAGRALWSMRGGGWGTGEKTEGDAMKGVEVLEQVGSLCPEGLQQPVITGRRDRIPLCREGSDRTPSFGRDCASGGCLRSLAASEQTPPCTYACTRLKLGSCTQ